MLPPHPFRAGLTCLLAPMLLLLLLLVAAPQPGRAASLQQVTANFGSNPRGVGFYIYVPDKLAARPPVLVNPHWCHGSAAAAYSGSQFAALADQYGYIVIYPNSSNTADMCWDLSSSETRTHDAGGDSLGIVNMVRWTLNTYGGDSSRVFVTGVSSGAMMTENLIGAYPDVFAAGSAWAGVPFGCFAGDGYDVWSNACATGQVTHTAAEWAALVAAAFPGYSGWRPKLQIFHGTADQVLNYANYGEAVKEWTAVLGLSQTPTSVTANVPKSGWTKSVYGNDWFEATSAANVTHDIGASESVVLNWFDLTCTTGNCFSWGTGSPTR